MTLRAWLFLPLACGLPLAAPAQSGSPAEPELLEPEKAFAAEARPAGADALAVTWRIADGYYM